MVTFYNYPKKQLAASANHQSSGVTVCRSSAANGRGQVDSRKWKTPKAVIWKMLLVAEKRFRRLKAPELIERRLPGHRICQWSPGQPSPGGESRLMFLHTY